MAGDPVTYEQMRDLLREQAGIIKGSGGASAASSGGGGGAALGGAIDRTVGGLGALATGTANTKDVINATADVLGKFGVAGQATGKMVSTFGGAVVDVNNTLKETGKYGVNFGQNLGEANKAVIQAQYTMPEFQEMIRSSGKSLAGVAGGQNESAKQFLNLAKEMQGTTVAQDLKAAGMSSQELNDVLLLTSKNSGRINMQDTKAREEAIGAALKMADEMNKVADLTGKSRKEQMAEIERVQARADVEAATLQKMKTDPEFANRMKAATNAMSEFGPGVQDLVAEMATGGARSKEALETLAGLGPAGAALEEYAKAVESGDATRIEAAKKAAVAATRAEVSSDQYLETAKITQGKILGQADVIHAQMQSQLNIAAEQKELAAAGKEATAEAAAASLAAKAEARERGIKTDVTGKPVIDEKTGKPKVDEGAVIGRTINQMENLGKVAGGTMANGFNKLNTEIGNTVNTTFPQFDAKLKEMSKNPEALTGAAQGAVKDVAAKAGVKSVSPEASKRAADLVKSGPDASIPKQATGSKDVFGDWFGKDWGAGGLSMLHGKEAVVPEGKIGEFFNDMTKNMPKPEKMASGLNEKMTAMISGIQSSTASAPPDFTKMAAEMGKNIQTSFSSMTTNMPQLMSETFSKATAPMQREIEPDMFERAPAAQGDVMNDVVKLLEMLNKQMGELISHTSDVAELSGKQVRATRGLSNNRLAV